MAMNKTLLRYWRSSRPLCLFVGERQRCGVELGIASSTLNCLVVFCNIIYYYYWRCCCVIIRTRLLLCYYIMVFY